MRKFTKLLFALALTMIGVQGVKAEKVYEINYADLDAFPFYVMGFTPEWVNGIMTDGGGGWHQYFIADGIPTIVGGSYKVKALVKASANVDFNVNMGWGWGDGQTTGTNVTVPQSDDFKEVVWEYSNIGGTSCNLVAQPNSSATIEWKSLAVYTADPKEVTVYGDLVEVTPTIYIKNYGETDEVAKTPATPDADGVYTINDAAGSGDVWAAQFWIAAPYALPAGKKFHVEFDYKADNAGTVATQSHRATPGSYIIWHCIGDVAFTDEWDHFESDVDVAGDMAGWQSIAFNMHLNSDTKYYIKGIVLKEPAITGEVVSFTVGSAGWASYSSGKNVDLGTAKGYAVKFNGSYVELTPVTKVPANNAVLIEGAGAYSFNVIASAAAIADNDLKVSDGNVTSDGTIYVLANKNSVPGFYKLASGQKVPAGKAYLQIPASAREFIGFDGATGIETVKTAKAEKAEEGIFNLQGQRLMKAQKGLNIINGKKVLVK